MNFIVIYYLHCGDRSYFSIKGTFDVVKYGKWMIIIEVAAANEELHVGHKPRNSMWATKFLFVA